MFNFLRKKRTEKFLFDQIALIGGKFIGNALKCASSLDANFQSVKGKPFTPSMFSQITVEYLMFFIHMTDRVLFHRFGIERNKYIDLLVALVPEALKGASFSESFPKFRKTLDVKEKIRVSPAMRNKAEDYIIADTSIYMDTFWIDELNMRNTEYAKYDKIVPDGNDSRQGTLIWEFGKNISFVIYNHQNDTDTIELSSYLASKHFTSIDEIALLTAT